MVELTGIVEVGAVFLQHITKQLGELLNLLNEEILVLTVILNKLNQSLDGFLVKQHFRIHIALNRGLKYIKINYKYIIKADCPIARITNVDIHSLFYFVLLIPQPLQSFITILIIKMELHLIVLNI